jgi:dolichyl-phosphate beta-glucosyltransferase
MISSAIREIVRSKARAFRTIDDGVGMSSGKYVRWHNENEAAPVRANGGCVAEPRGQRHRLRQCIAGHDLVSMTEPRDVKEEVHLTLVVPCYNGADRLPASLRQLSEFIAAQPYAAELVVVDDCSDEPAARVLREYAAAHPCMILLRNERNSGKGASVARGMLAGRGRYRVFLDADLAYPPDQVNRILVDLSSGADVAIACRVLPDSRYVMSPTFFHYLYTRHVQSRVFNAMVRALLLPGVLDSQAGLKGFTARAAQTVFSRLSIPGFGFDVEALFIAKTHGLTIRQTAVHFRYDDEPTTVRLVQSAATMAGDLLQVRLNGWRRKYD